MKHFYFLLLLCLAQLSVFAQPFISSFIPASGPVNSPVDIYGTGFSAIASENIVFFGATRATVSTASSTVLKVIVPAGASFEPITVTRSGLTAYSRSPFIVTYNSSGTITTSTFSVRTDIPSSINGPGYLVVKDLNDDGKPDIVYSGSEGVSINKNISTPGLPAFAPRISLAGPGFNNYIAVGDLDGDGKPDIVSADFGALFHVFRNTSAAGVISFTPGQSFTSSGVYGINIADMDGDGKPDIVTTDNTPSGNVLIFRNTSTVGNISFGTEVQFTAGSSPRGITFGFIDDDFKPDLIVANQGSKTLSIFTNNSTPGNFSLARTNIAMPSTSSPEFGIALDANQDGLIDIAASGNNSGSTGTISVFRTVANIPSLFFAPAVNLTSMVNWNPYQLQAGDLNGDGKPDLVAINQINDHISIYPNNSAGSTISFDRVDILSSNLTRGSLAIVDADGDNKPDLVAGGSTAIYIYHNSLTVLPVKFFGFEVARIANGTLLKWKVENENDDVLPYEIQRSLDGVVYAKIGSIARQNNNLPSKTYSFTDQDVLSDNVIYYRIKQTDRDGHMVYSDVKTVNNVAATEMKATIFPNPVANLAEINIRLTQNAAINFSLYNALGLHLQTYSMAGKNGLNKKQIDLTGIPSGNYFIRINANNSELVLPVVVQH
jgi:hypothetical protein